ncbi:MAG: acetyl-CoA carboxylase biotin carboxyl carrier protein subunit [Anaerolineales bacterium]
MKYITTVNDKEYLIEVIDERHILVNGRALQVDFDAIHGQPVFSLLLDGRSFEGFVYSGDEQLEVLLMGRQFPVKVEDEREKRLRAAGGSAVSEAGEFHLKAPMPGMVVSIPVEEGQKVEKGQVLLILESMKMQNELKAPRAGIIHRIRVRAGESVEQKQTLLSVQ